MKTKIQTIMAYLHLSKYHRLHHHHFMEGNKI